MKRDLCGYRAEDGPILVTGAGGFVGRALMEKFRLGAGDYAADSTSEFTSPPGVTKVAWELPGPPPSSLGSVRYVIHLAGLSSVAHSHTQVEKVMAVNAGGAGSVADWVCKACPGARILFVSSAEVYKPSLTKLAEDSTLEPGSPYGRSKLMAEKIIAESGADYVVSRSFPHYGPGQQGHFVLPSFCRRIIESVRMGSSEIKTGNLQAVRDYLYIEDVIRAYACILTQGRSGGVYNVCSGTGHTIGELLDLLMTVSGSGLKAVTDPCLLRKADQFCQVGDPGKLRELGWEPGVSLEMGLELLYRWWEERL